MVFTKPTTWEHTSGDGSLLIKRALGLPGDSISLKDRMIYVTGREKLPLPEGYSCPRGNQELKLSSGEIFAVGDNAEVSVDSRHTLCNLGAKASVVPTSSIVNHGSIALTL